MGQSMKENVVGIDSLNPILDGVNRKSKKQDKSSASFSSINWSDVKSVFPMALLTINSIPIEESKLELLHTQLSNIHQLYGQVIWQRIQTPTIYISHLECCVHFTAWCDDNSRRRYERC